VRKTNSVNLSRALTAASVAAKAAGALMRRNWRVPKRVNQVSQYDIKLELDVRCQKLIEKHLRAAFPQINLLAEEGDSGDIQQEYRWVVDPIDGTVNFAYGIPHACVSIAMQMRSASVFAPLRRDKECGVRNVKPRVTRLSSHVTLLGVVYDPFCDELWSAVKGGPAKLNGRAIHVSTRNKLADCLVTTGFAKSPKSLDEMLPFFGRLARNVRKVRMLGSAALALTYVATGRLDAYVESRVNLWDICAGGLILERAGGEFWRESLTGEEHACRLIASNGRLRKQLQALGLFAR
jgi:myo-inositol-1(or 4)-monophosphatase